MKRLLDILLSVAGLGLSAPILLPVMFLIWRQDRRSPFYIAPRVGRSARTFRMIKLRSMIADADKSGVASTSDTDQRITPVGHFVRRYKLDELTQLINVLKGEMSLVGPRPNVAREVALYTDEERQLLSVRPGITDLASIVFSDEGDVLAGSEDPDLQYNQVIRPWKSRLGLVYIARRDLWMDLRILALTAIAIFNRNAALRGVNRILTRLKVPMELIEVSRRERPLLAHPPPGAAKIVQRR